MTPLEKPFDWFSFLSQVDEERWQASRARYGERASRYAPIFRAPLSTSSLARVERALRTRLPDELRELLRQSNGVNIMSFDACCYGDLGEQVLSTRGIMRFTIDHWQRFRRDELPQPGFVIFAREDFGSYGFCAPGGVCGNEVFYADDYDENLDGPQLQFVAPSLHEFLRHF